MLCANLVCMWLMFNTLKVAQAEKQIYPERFGKLSNFHTSPGARTGEVAGAPGRAGRGLPRTTAGRVNGAPERVPTEKGCPAINGPRKQPHTGSTEAYHCSRSCARL